MRNTKRKSLQLLLLVNLMPVFLGLVLGLLFDLFLKTQADRSGPQGWPPDWLFAAIPAAFIVLCVLVFLPAQVRTARHSDTIVLAGLRARRATVLEEQRMYNVLSEVAIAAGVPTPMLAVIDEPTPNALVVGPPGAPTIAVTTGLLEHLGRAQIEAVAGHLLARVIDGDTRYQTLLAAMLLRMEQVMQSSKKAFGAVRAYALMLVGAAYLSRAVTRRLSGAASRERVLLADDLGVHLVRNPRALIEALRVMQHDAATWSSLPRCLAPLFFVDPAYAETMCTVAGVSFRSDAAGKDSDSHPSIVDRIQRIQALLA